MFRFTQTGQYFASPDGGLHRRAGHSQRAAEAYLPTCHILRTLPKTRQNYDQGTELGGVQLSDVFISVLTSL